jgi:pilus assembly protein CpaF
VTTTHADARTTAHDELVERLDAHVREVVRREGVDPQADAGVVRRIAESVVRDHDERSLTGVVAPVPDAAAVVGELVARVSGFGPLQPYLDDPDVEEVWINDPSRVFVARHGRHELTNLVLSRAQVQELVERMLKSSGRRIDLSQPFVDAMLPEGHRLHVVLEGISRGFSAVNIRKFTVRAHRLQSLVELGSLSPRAAAFLEASVRAGLNILVAGGTQAGKTTMLNCLAAAIPGGERVVSAEEVYELTKMAKVQTCEPLCTYDKASTERARGRRSRVRRRIASGSVLSVAGTSSGSGRRTTRQRPRRSRDRCTSRCLGPLIAGRPMSWWRGMWIGSRGS